MTESRCMVCRSRETVGWGVTTNEYVASFGGDEHVLELDYDDDCTIL